MNMTPEQRAARAHRAKQAMEEFISPAFDYTRAEFINRMGMHAASKPWAVDEIRALALAVKVLDEVRGQVSACILDGEVAARDMIKAEQVERIRPSKRKILGI